MNKFAQTFKNKFNIDPESSEDEAYTPPDAYVPPATRANSSGPLGTTLLAVPHYDVK
jgi:hypothetical protein